MKEIYFVRHAESESNADGVHRGPGAMLNEKGLTQAQVVAERIEKIGVEALISSTYPRAKATAAPISERIGLPIEESELFVERRTPSVAMGKTFKDPEVREALTQMFAGYVDETHRHSDEENFQDLKDRALKALAYLEAHEKSRICVVSHGLFLRVLFCAAVHGADFTGKHLQDAFEALETENTGISYFKFDVSRWGPEERERWKIVSWNDSAHLG